MTASPPAGSAPSADDIDLTQSAAGEEDPGASLDTSAADASGPGDQPAPPKSTGEKVCPECGGSGRRAGGECPTCRGLGKVIVGIGGD